MLVQLPQNGEFEASVRPILDEAAKEYLRDTARPAYRFGLGKINRTALLQAFLFDHRVLMLFPADQRLALAKAETQYAQVLTVANRNVLLVKMAQGIAAKLQTPGRDGESSSNLLADAQFPSQGGTLTPQVANGLALPPFPRASAEERDSRIPLPDSPYAPYLRQVSQRVLDQLGSPDPVLQRRVQEQITTTILPSTKVTFRSVLDKGSPQIPVSYEFTMVKPQRGTDRFTLTDQQLREARKIDAAQFAARLETALADRKVNADTLPAGIIATAASYISRIAESKPRKPTVTVEFQRSRLDPKSKLIFVNVSIPDEKSIRLFVPDSPMMWKMIGRLRTGVEMGLIPHSAIANANVISNAASARDKELFDKIALTNIDRYYVFADARNIMDPESSDAIFHVVGPNKTSPLGQMEYDYRVPKKTLEELATRPYLSTGREPIFGPADMADFAEAFAQKLQLLLNPAESMPPHMLSTPDRNALARQCASAIYQGFVALKVADVKTALVNLQKLEADPANDNALAVVDKSLENLRRAYVTASKIDYQKPIKPETIARLALLQAIVLNGAVNYRRTQIPMYPNIQNAILALREKLGDDFDVQVRKDSLTLGTFISRTPK